MAASYLPPVFNWPLKSLPPQTIISVSVQTALGTSRAEGALVVLVGVQLSASGVYLPPVLNRVSGNATPAQTIIWLPVQTAVWSNRASGALLVLVAAQVSVPGSYLPPVLKSMQGEQKAPPQTIISLPVHTAVCEFRASGALMVLIDIQLSVPGLYLPPVFRALLPLNPPQTIISLSAQTAV
jgi:hypothetical protein